MRVAVRVPGELGLAGVEGHMLIDVQSPAITAASMLEPFGPVTGTHFEDELGSNCIDKISGYCPVVLYTDAGALALELIEETSTGSVVVESNTAVTPEPGTWVMVGRGRWESWEWYGG